MARINACGRGEVDWPGLSDDDLAGLAGTPAVIFGSTYASGAATTFLRTDDQIKFPTVLMSSANSSTLTLTDDAVDQTLAGNLGVLRVTSADDSMALPSRIVLGAPGANPAPDSAAFFVTRTSLTGTFMRAGLEGGVTADDGGSYTSQTFFGGLLRVSTSNGTTFTTCNARVLELQPTPVTFTSGTHSFTNRDGLLLAGNIVPLQSGSGAVTSTTVATIRNTGWPVIGNPGTVTNAYECLFKLPTAGGTIRRGVHLSTVTSNVGTEAANVEGFYCEDIARGTSRRANFYAEGATTGTPTDVYGFFQGTAHVVGTNRDGARYTGATTGTPTTVYGAYSDSHAVGTNRWSYWGSNKFHCDASDFIANASAFGFCNRDSQSSSAGGGGTARYWRSFVDASATGVAGDVTLAIDSAGNITATRAGGATGTVLFKLIDVGVAPVTA